MRSDENKWYLAERRESEHHYYVLDLGPFCTETQAYAQVYQAAKIQDPAAPSQRLQERRPEFQGRRITTVTGRRILAHPELYRQ